VRNTKVADIVKALKDFGLDVEVYDPWANSQVAEHEYNIKVSNQIPTNKYDAAVVAVAHNEFKNIDIVSMMNANHVIFDVKAFMPRDIIDGRL